jgi:RNA polymerase sigma-70 factor (ECF subfamily)
VDTSASLLDRIRLAADPADWQRLVDLYTPLIRGWLRRYGVRPDDGDDLVQDVLAVVVRRVPEFQHNHRRGAFRSWLRHIAVNRLREYWRQLKARPDAPGGDLDAALEQLEDGDSPLSRQWDREHDLHVTRRLLDLLCGQFESTTWEAFRRTALDGRPADEVAAELGMTPNAVYVARSRVLARLRREAAGLVD